MGVIEVLFDGTNLDVVMPYAGSGDLFQMLQESQERGTGFTEPEARYWFRQLVAGVRHLHTRGVTHRDLSPENVMIDDGNSLIIDMGMAIRVPYTDPKSTTNGVTDIAHGTNRRLILPQGACGKLPYSKLLLLFLLLLIFLLIKFHYSILINSNDFSFLKNL